MNQRDRVAQLAKTDFAAAFKLSGSLENVRERIQSLGWIARYAPPDKISRVITAVKKNLGTSSDVYEDVMSLAWPLRALHETGNPKLIPPLLHIAMQMAPNVSPVASRAESVGLLIHAVLPAGLSLASPAISTLVNRCGDEHWRAVRALVDASLLVNPHDRKQALKIANAISNLNKRKTTIYRIENGERNSPRAFFW
jgi:hypothetical protein